MKIEPFSLFIMLFAGLIMASCNSTATPTPPTAAENTAPPATVTLTLPTFTPRIELSPTLNSFQQLLATRQAATLPPATQTPVPTRRSASRPEVIAWEETISLLIASSAPFDDARGQQLIFHNGYVYMFGGAGAGEPRLKNVYFSAIGQDGRLAGWVETTSLPGQYYDHVVVNVGEYVYLLTGAAGAEDVFYIRHQRTRMGTHRENWRLRLVVGNQQRIKWPWRGMDLGRENRGV